MQQYQEGMTATGPNGETAVFRGGQWVVVPAQTQGPMTIGTPDPAAAYAAPLAQANLAAKQADVQRAPAEAALAEAKAREAEANARAAESQGAAGAAKQRADAIDAYRSAIQLRNIADDLTRQYNSAIKNGGIDRIAAGLIGAFPTDENKTFSDTGNQARALIKKALGFTGGEGNTATESVINYGPYLPQAGDYNAQIENKIAALYRLADQSQQKSVATLGGVPDENGRITPIAPPHAPKNGSGQGGNGPDGPDRTTRLTVNGTGPNGGGGLALSQDGTQAVPDPVGQAAAVRLNAMLKGGASDAEIANYAAQVGRVSPDSVSAALRFRQEHPDYRGDYSFSGFEQKNVPMSFFREGLNRLSQSPVGAYGMSAANALTLNTLDNAFDDPALVRAGMDAASAAHPVASGLGTLTGGALAAGGLEAGAGGIAARYAPALAQGRWIPRLADALYGAGSGAGAADEGNRGKGALLGGITGTVGGALGRGVTRGIANSASGIRNAAIDELRTRNIPLTVGQALSQSGRFGAAVKGIEDRLSGLPVVGDVVNARRNEGLRQFNRAAFDEALAPIGQTTAGNIGETGIQQAQDLVSGAYDNALSGAQATIDPEFGAALAGAVGKARNLPRVGNEVVNSLNATIPPYFGPNGAISGRNLQAALRDLKGLRSGYKNDPLGSRVGETLRDAEGAMSGLFERQAPEAMEGYNRANAAYRNLATLQDAVGDSAKNTDGIFTPAQLTLKAAQGTKKFGGKAANARGDRPFFDLTRAAQDVLPSKVPDSGTAGRLATLALPAALGGASGYALDDTKSGLGAGLTLGALLAAGGSKAGQKALTTALLSRPQTLRVIGDQIRRQAGKGGIFGASLSQIPTQALLTGY